MGKKIKAKDLRKKTHREKEPCYICGRYRVVCEWHHVISLGEVAKIFSDNLCDVFKDVLISLCPTHHSLLHKYMSGKEPDCLVALTHLVDDNYQMSFELVEERSKVILNTFDLNTAKKLLGI